MFFILLYTNKNVLKIKSSFKSLKKRINLVFLKKEIQIIETLVEGEQNYSKKLCEEIIIK